MVWQWDRIFDLEVVFVEINDTNRNIKGKVNAVFSLCNCSEDTNFSSVLCFRCLTLKSSKTKGKEVCWHTRGCLKSPNPSFFTQMAIDFRHVWQGDIAFFSIKFQWEIKSRFGFWFINWWEGFTRKMRFKLRWNNFFLLTIVGVIWWVNPCHIICNTTREFNDKRQNTGLWKFNMEGFVSIIHLEVQWFIIQENGTNGKVFLVKGDMVIKGFTCDGNIPCKSLFRTINVQEKIVVFRDETFDKTSNRCCHTYILLI